MIGGLSDNAPKYIYDALQIIDRANMNEEELEMITNTEYLQSVYDGQMNYAKREAIMEVALKLLKRNRPIEEIMEDTGLTEEQIEELQNSLL